VITLPRSEAPTPSTPPPPGTTYVVQSGDTMGKIARRFKITMAELIAANPSIPNPDSIFPGQVLAVPTPA
jgi:LysM repeat protein